MAKVALIGDIGLFGRHTTGNPRYMDHFVEVSRILAGHDIVIGNLETPMTTSGKRYGGKSAYIRAEPVDVEILRFLNVSCVSLANNHIMDFGVGGLEDTIRTLEHAGIKWFGVRRKPLDLRVQGESVYVSGYCGLDTNPEGMLRGRINAFSVKGATESLKKAERERKFPILSVHYGVEHRSFPCARHVDAFRRLASQYNFVLHGHHSHAFQPVEEQNESLLAYSLGNFCFDDVIDTDTGEIFLKMRDTGRVGGIVTVEIDHCRLQSWSVLPMLDTGRSLEMNSPVAADKVGWIQELFRGEMATAVQHGDAQRRAFVHERKSARNATFYLKRIKPRYVRMLVLGRINQIVDRKLVR